MVELSARIGICLMIKIEVNGIWQPANPTKREKTCKILLKNAVFHDDQVGFGGFQPDLSPFAAIQPPDIHRKNTADLGALATHA